MNNDDLVAKLRSEVIKSKVAENAFKTYVKEFLEVQYAACYREFIAAVDDQEALRVRTYLLAIEKLETAMLSDIQTGRMAEKQLEAIDNGR